MEAFKSSDPEQARGGEMTARQILDGGAAKIRAGIQDSEMRATLLAGIGEVYVGLGLFDEAEPLLLEALELRRGADVDAGLGLYQIGSLELARRNYQTAEEHYRDALPRFREGSVEHARCLRDLGLAVGQQGKRGESEENLKRALVTLQAYFSEKDPEILQCLFGLALTARDRGDYPEAEKLLRDIIETQSLGGEPGPALGRSLAELGVVRYRQGELEEARTLLEEALPILRDTLGQDNTYVAEVLGKLVAIKISLGDDIEAEKLIGEILELLPNEHPGVGIALHNHGMILLGRGEFLEAKRITAEALRRKRAAFGKIHEEIALSLCLLGAIALEQREPDVALDYYEQCAEIMSAVHPATHPQTTLAWMGLGRSTEILQGCRAAEKWYRRAYLLRLEKLGASHPATTLATNSLGACLAKLGKDNETEPQR